MKVEFENDWIGKKQIKIRVIKSFEGSLQEFEEISNRGILINEKNNKEVTI